MENDDGEDDVDYNDDDYFPETQVISLSSLENSKEL
jgi:hypothetical protein